MAFEKLLDVEVPRRAEYIRVLSGELNRVASHALFMGWMALDLGGLTPILWSFIERDEIVDMLAASPASGCSSTTSGSVASTATSTTSS